MNEQKGIFPDVSSSNIDCGYACCAIIFNMIIESKNRTKGKSEKMLNVNGKIDHITCKAKSLHAHAECE